MTKDKTTIKVRTNRFTGAKIYNPHHSGGFLRFNKYETICGFDTEQECRDFIARDNEPATEIEL